MKKRGFFFVLVLALSATLAFAATEQYTDLGTAQPLEVTEEKLSDAQANTASTVTVITSEQIAAYNAESTADLIGKAIGTSYNSTGALGAAQTVSVRGFSSNKTLVYLDGELLNTAHQGTVDLTTIPVSAIDHIEIIKNGTGNLGKAVAFGGIVNIVTKKATEDKPTTTISFENGSFLPKTYTDGTTTNQDWRSLVDSQKLDVTYSNTFSDKLSLLATVGGTYAQNGYTYSHPETGARLLRENNSLTDVHSMINLNGKITDKISYQSDNLISYQYYRVPGGYGYYYGSWYTYLTPDNYQQTLTLSTNNTITFSNIKASLSYLFTPLWYHDTTASQIDSRHMKHKGNLGFEESWSLGENANIKTGETLSIDFVDSNVVGTHSRIEPHAYANGAFYFLDGKLGVYPAVNLGYATSPNTFLANASLGTVYTVSSPLSVSASVSYAENLPTFSDLYWVLDSWGMHGNPDLKKERGVNGEAGVTYKTQNLTYEGSVFTKYMVDAISWSGYDATTSQSWPENIANSVYFGTEQAITVTPLEGLSLTASYLLNQSYDLSYGQTIDDGIEVSGIRKHTAKFSASYVFKMFTFSLDGQYLGATYQQAYPSIFLMNISVKAQVMEKLEVYAAIDNLLDTEYYYANYYPMPGMKIRLGGTYTL
jgi:vitamin B12 transporter